jgi:hypothetical protein
MQPVVLTCYHVHRGSQPPNHLCVLSTSHKVTKSKSDSSRKSLHGDHTRNAPVVTCGYGTTTRSTSHKRSPHSLFGSHFTVTVPWY